MLKGITSSSRSANNSVSRLAALCLTAAFTMGAVTGSAMAQTSPSSAYEKFKLKECTETKALERSHFLLCEFKKGPNLTFEWHEHGVDLYLADAHKAGKYKTDPTNFKLSRTGHFGELVENAKGNSTVEWRVKLVKGKWQPFAIIIRTSYAFFNSAGEGKGRERLDIIKIDANHSCQIGTVEALTPNHNVLAREIADKAIDMNPCPSAQ